MKSGFLGTRSERARIYVRYSRASDLPLFVLALIMVLVLLAPELLSLSREQARLLEIVDWFIYGCFAVDFLLKLYLAPSVHGHLRRNWIDVIILALPLLRPLRLLGGGAGLRLLRLARASTFSVEAMRKLIRSMVRRGLLGVAVMIVAVALVGALLVVGFERNSAGNIKSIGDAIWWAIATVSTVGYGDYLPVTVEGRVVAVILMVMGVVFYSILTANLAAFFVETTSEGDDTATRKSFEELGQKLESIEQELAALRGGGQISVNGNLASGAAPPLNDDPAVKQTTERGTR